MRLLWLIIILCIPANNVYAQTDCVLPLDDESRAEVRLEDVEVNVEDIAIDFDRFPHGARGNLFFHVILKNTSVYHKTDICFPVKVDLEDEFGNQYRSLLTQVENASASDTASLYPGDEIRIACHFETPVAAAKALTIYVKNSGQQLSHRLDVETRDIANWKLISNERALTNDDMIVVYPRDKRVFKPGERIYLKLDFSRRAGRPDNIHVVLPDYILTDDEAKGQYELSVPADRSDEDFQVIVMAEWGNSLNPIIISKTLSFKIKG